MHVRIEDGILSFDSPGIRAGALSPSIRIKTGEDEVPVVLRPDETIQKKCIYIDTCAGPAQETAFIFKAGKDYYFHWSAAVLTGGNGFVLKSRFHNASAQPVRLSEMILGETEPEAVICEGNPAEWHLSTLAHDTRIGNLAETLPSMNEGIVSMWKGFGLPVPFPLQDDAKSTDGSWRTYKDFITLYTDGGARGLSIGPVGSPEADIRYDCQVKNGKLGFCISSEMTDVIVESGGFRDSQEVLVIAAPCGDALNTIFNWIAFTHGHRTHRKPLTGWCSWYDLASGITEESVMSTISSFATIKDRIAVDVLQIDDGYQRQVGDWEANEKFPHGFGDIIGKIKEAGAMPGIWLAPLAVHETTGLIGEHPDWFQRDVKGELLGEANNWGPRSRWLDPTHPGAKDFMRKIIRDKKSEGFTYFKIDFNNIDGGCRLHDACKTRLQAFRDLYRLYREEMGEDAYLLSCSAFTRGTIGYADASRIGPDSCNTWSAAHPCTILEAIRAVGMNASANRTFYTNDPDVTYLRTKETMSPTGAEPEQEKRNRGINPYELQTWHSFVGLLGGLSLISDPIHKTEYADHLRMLEILNPPHMEKASSLTPGADRNHTQFGFLCRRPWGTFAAVLVWNPQDAPAHAAINLRTMEALGSDFHVWSFWNETYLGKGPEAVKKCMIPPHGCLLLRLTAAEQYMDGASLVGSDLHLSMGAVEIDGFSSTSTAAAVYLNKGGAGDGNLYFHCRHPLSLDKCTGCQASLEKMDGNVWKLALKNRSRTAGQSISLHRK